MEQVRRENAEAAERYRRRIQAEARKILLTPHVRAARAARKRRKRAEDKARQAASTVKACRRPSALACVGRAFGKPGLYAGVVFGSKALRQKA